MSIRNLRPALPVVLLALGLPLQAAEFSGSAAITSDYVFRGISQSNERPAWQLGTRVDTASGVYGSAWASRVQYASAPGADAEIDYVVGIRRPLGQHWTGDLNATWFTYAGAPELDYLEGIATATWREHRWVTLGFSNDVFATRRSGVYAHLGTRIPLNEAVRLELSGGYYWLQRPYAHDYAHAQASVAWLPHPKVELRLGGHLADHRARVLFGDVADPRIEASLQASF